MNTHHSPVTTDHSTLIRHFPAHQKLFSLTQDMHFCQICSCKRDLGSPSPSTSTAFPFADPERVHAEVCSICVFFFSLLSFNQAKENNLSQGYDQNMAMVGLGSMQKANDTLEDFCRSYFMFHGLDVSKPQSFFKHLPILSFFESYVYQLDNINEELLQAPKGKYEIAAQDLVSCVLNDPFRPLVTVFEHKGLLTERIREELRHGGEYWGLERKLCYALTNKGEILIDDVMKAMHLRSFDYWVLSLLLYQQRGAKVEELHMEFFSISAFLTEISDDLRFQYYNLVHHNCSVVILLRVGLRG